MPTPCICDLFCEWRAPTSRVLRVWTRRLLQLSTSTLSRPSTPIVHNNQIAASNNSLHCTINQVKWVVVTMLKMNESSMLKMNESRQYDVVSLSSRTTLQQTAMLLGLTPSQLLQQHQKAWVHATAPTYNHTHSSLIATPTPGSTCMFTTAQQFPQQPFPRRH